MTGSLRGPRRMALAVIALVLAAASAVALAESYRGLYDWGAGPWPARRVGGHLAAAGGHVPGGR